VSGFFERLFLSKNERFFTILSGPVFMRLENQQSTGTWRVGGLVACGGALVLAVATGGGALVPALMLLALGGYYAGRATVEAVVLSEHFRTLSVTRSQWFGSATRTFPFAEVTAREQAQGGLRSTKYYTLVLEHQGRPVAELDPKAGYDRVGMARFHAALLTAQAVDTARTAASKT